MFLVKLAKSYCCSNVNVQLFLVRLVVAVFGNTGFAGRGYTGNAIQSWFS